MRAKQKIFVFLVFVLVLEAVRVCNADGLKKNFYQKSCSEAENLVRTIIWRRAQVNPNLGAKLLRMFFHDCFVRGCDASILLDAANNSGPPEKFASPNLLLSGFDVIEDIKIQMEQLCPGVVSCADILALATRDSVTFPSKKPLWDVLTGRRDGNISLASNVFGNIPSPLSDFDTLLQFFANKGLDLHDLVILSGAHTIGVAHCATFSKRLYNFTGKGDTDPSMDPAYAKFLKTQCPNPPNPQTTVELDSQGSILFDTHYYTNLIQNKSLLLTDAALLNNKASSKIVIQLGRTKSNHSFFSAFGKSMEKLGTVQVLTGTAGEIRKKCNLVNS